jgi:hypothetical protein
VSDTLYPIISRKVPHAQSAIAFASVRLRIMFVTCQVPGVGDPLPVAGDREVGDPQVHPGGPARGGERLGFGYVDGERDVPASARVPDTVTVDGSTEAGSAGSVPGQDQMNGNLIRCDPDMCA